MRAWHLDLAGLAALLALTGAGYLAGVQQELLQRERRAAHQLASQRLDDDAAKAADRVRRFREVIRSASSAVESDRFTPRPRERLNDVLAQITRLAEDSSLSIDALTPGQSRDGALFQTVSLRLGARGDFPDLLRFLRRLHQLLPDLATAGFVLTGDPAEPQRPLALQLDLSWHAVKSDPAAPAGSTASSTRP